jgi:predicted transcriptional regulator
MARDPDDRPDGLPDVERDRVERFLAAFNTIDRLLRERTKIHDHGVPFRTVLRRYARDHRAQKMADRLDDYAELRNLLVHETLVPNGWLAVPSADVVRRIEGYRDALDGGRRADDAFKRRVATVSPATPMRDALAQAHATGFSQFPVVDGDVVVGLLTDRGIARWLAARAADGDAAAVGDALERATVADVVQADADRTTWALAARDEPAERVLARFVDAPELEAVLVTQHGEADQGLLGIATHLDVVRFWDAT